MLSAYHRSEGFPERHIWFLGTFDQGSAQIPEFLGNRGRRRRPRRPVVAVAAPLRAPPRPRPAGARRPPTPRKEFLQISMDIEVQ